jgi:ATP-dependent exoDNAse (exonuclease V) beta subunit
MARFSRDESALDLAPQATDGTDPLDYGKWWHTTLEFLPWAAARDIIEEHGRARIAEADGKGFGARAREEWERLLVSEPWRLMGEPRWTRLAEAGIFAPYGAEGWIDGVIDLVLHDAAADELWIVDWKTNQRAAQEDDQALLGRLAAEYRGQLSAYGACASGFFPGAVVALWIYSTVAGKWIRSEGPS